MSDTDYSRQTADLFFMKHDQTQELRQFRNFIPEYVLKTFCGSGDPNMLVVYEENQMHLIGDGELLTLFHPEQQEFEPQHWRNCFGKNDIYASYFENLTRQAFESTGVSKFLSLQRVDREIYTQLADPIWQIHGNQPLSEVPFPREDINTFRKFLYLMTSVGNRERNMHLLAHHEFMENARIRRRKFIENNDLQHARDVWLRNVDRMLDTPHHQVPSTTSIFDLDRADYKANAVERYMVFWEAMPGDEFILTDSAFGGFEGGQIGAKKNSKIDMTPLQMEQHLYTRDFMWHQIYVLSPTLVVALCHPTLMHPDLTARQRKRWGLRKSLLESLPHELPHRYYKDMKRNDMNFTKEGWQLPVEVEQAFAPANARGFDRRRDEDVVFPMHRLTSSQVAMVNSVLLHNQELGAKIQSVCVRPPPSYRCFLQSLRQFQHDPWPKYSEETQNDYNPLLQRLEEYLQATLPPTPPNLPSNYPYHSHEIPVFGAPTFGNMHYSALSTSDVQRYDEQFDAGHPQSSTQSSLTSSFAPSSQSAYSFSSTSSQSSASTKTTSLDTPRFDPMHLEHQQRNRSPTRRDSGHIDRGLGDGFVRRSNTNPKRSKPDVKSLNFSVEKSLQEGEALSRQAAGYLSAPHGHDHMHQHGNYQIPPSRGRNTEVRSNPPSNPPSKRASPNPFMSEPHRMPQIITPPSSNNSSIPTKKNYATENGRPGLSHRQAEPSPVIQARPNVHGHQNAQYVPEMQAPPPRRINRSPERQFVPDLPPPPQRRVNHSPEGKEYREPVRPTVRRSATISEPVLPPRVERSPEQNGPLVDARGRRYEPIRLEPALPLPEPVRGRPQHSIRSEQSPAAAAQPQPQPSQERSVPQQVIDSVRERLNQVINSEVAPQQVKPQQQLPIQRSANRSAERKQEPQTQPQRNTVQTANGHVYQMVAPSQPPTRALTAGNPLPQAQPQPLVQQAPIAQPQAQAQTQPQPKQQPQPEQRIPSSTNTSATTEHPTRFGVEIVRGRSLNNSQTSSQPQKSPVTVENLEHNALAIMPFQEPVQQAPVVKQLRFETPIKSISRRYSDRSLAESMMVQVGDTPSRLESEYDESEESESDDDSYDDEEDSESEGEDDDDASWEDEGFAEAEEIANKSKVVRFADKPLPSPKPLQILPRNVNSIFEKAALLRKGLEIERPNSRQGRRVEIARPLSRSGHRFNRHSLAAPPRRL
ncbi:hypothetical protein BZA05DRAFT_444063 [Tricharina praecox]|uniref:uncharacterized protein n=1 Tax=Tricharina praecox TaxID=43433 RepID=UPI00221E81B7|nr:uncharacterized protein BZA05DRAFT_444063 [Tricharina praecox]KAI5853779.1 hypothetical protein BZA05DRAFT_444063 [Tricharina praecox]